MKIPFWFLFLVVGPIAVLAETRLEQFGVGGELILNPVDPPKPITTIAWKHNGDIVAEWIKDTVPLLIYPAFEGRTELDLVSGQLKIKNTKKTDQGVFTAEINNKVQSVSFSVKEVKPVPEPEVLVRPLTCNMDSPSCKLTCGRKSGSDVTESEPVQYFWKQGNGPWNESKKDMDITNDEKTRGVQTFSCKMKNKISEKESEPERNPLLPPPSSQSPSVIVGVVVVVLGILALVFVLGYLKREEIKKCLPDKKTDNNATNVHEVETLTPNKPDPLSVP